MKDDFPEENYIEHNKTDVLERNKKFHIALSFKVVQAQFFDNRNRTNAA